MAIFYQNEEVKFPPIKRREVSRWINSIISSFDKKPGEISYMFCSDRRILEVNREYLRHDYYTDIITFDYVNGDIISGDMFISLDTVKSNAEKFGTEYMDELYRVIIHGILHLCGINDKTDEEQAEMTRYENKALEELKNYKS